MSPARDMAAVFNYIKSHEQEALAELVRFCAQPSVSADGRGMTEMLEIVRERLERSNFKVEVVPLEGGYPAIYAESLDETPADAPVLLFYNHYDVQPEGDPALWTSPPFAPEIRDGKFYARGVADNKGNLIARLAAIDALRASDGELPLKIKWVIEGEEEIGSPTLAPFLHSYHDRLAADGCVWEFGGFNWEGRPEIMLGLKGMLLIELSCQGPNRDIHSSMAAYVANPVWRLLWALGTMKDENEYVTIEGFYDSLRPPSSAELAMVAALPDDDKEVRQDLGVAEFAVGVSGYGRRVAEVFSPTCNIQGIWGGYTGAGSKTILPSTAHARLDLRLVPDQDPENIVELLRTHLDEKGFTDIELKVIEGSLSPARTDPNHPFVQLTRDVCTELAGIEPVVSPSSSASGPMSLFSGDLGLPVVAIGVGYPGAGAHSPDENVRLEDFRKGTQQIALLIQRMSEAGADALRHTTVATAVAVAAPVMIEEIEIFSGFPEIDFAAIEAEMNGGIDESRALPATTRPEIAEALEDIARAQEMADELMLDENQLSASEPDATPVPARRDDDEI